MSNVNKPVIPRIVADAIELLRRKPLPFDNQRILSVAAPDPSCISIGRTTNTLRSIPFDTLLAALINGYDVEKTPEESAHERIAKEYRNKRFLPGLFVGGPLPIASAKATGFADGIKFALDELGVKIGGVNV